MAEGSPSANGNVLPRLAYIGEVCIRRLSSGPAVLYRLLETYPADRLLVAESDQNERDPATELPGVRATQFYLMNFRLLRTRLSPWYGAWVYLNAARRARALVPLLREFRTEAVLTVAHGYGWITAAAAAQRLKVPLHLICHDFWEPFAELPTFISRRADALFRRTYREAGSRLLVSPQMEAYYRARYNCDGTVLYPSRSASGLELDAPPLRLPRPGAFVFAFAGSSGRGLRGAIIAFANAVAPLGGRLRIYQTIPLETLRREGLSGDNVEVLPFRPAAELHRELVESADAMFLPMSFAPEDRQNTELCFPSKLADYTVVGLPILICSPEYGTAACWARSWPHAAELVTSLDPTTLAAAANRLIQDAAHREKLAWAALRAGREVFGQEVVFATLRRRLLTGRA